MSNFNIKEKKLTTEEIAVLGVPFDKNSSFRRGVLWSSKNGHFILSRFAA